MRKRFKKPSRIAEISALSGKTLGERLAKARIEAGLTQKQLSRKSGISDKTIRMCEKNSKRIRIETVIKLATPLNVSPKYLLGYGDEAHSIQNYFDKLALLPPTKQQRVFKFIESLYTKA